MCADIFGFCCDCLNMLRVNVACKISRSYKFKGESVVRATQSRHKVIIEGTDEAFCCVTMMNTGQDKLVSEIIVCIKVFHDWGRFVI